MTKNDGGPAFPRIAQETDSMTRRTHWHTYNGMSLRDWFAGMALKGYLSNSRYDSGFPDKGETAEIAELAGKYADAMLKERAREE